MQVLNYLQNLLVTHWEVILSYLGAGGSVSVVLQFVKRLRKWESTAWIEFVLGTMTSITAATNYIINNYVTSPLPTIFGNFAPKILLASLLVHRILVSPLSKLIEQKLIPWIANLKMAIAELKAAKAASTTTQKAIPKDSTTTFESS